MVNVPELERRSIAGKTLIYLGIAAVVFAVATLYIVYNISHNLYVSAYYTIGSLFDAVGISVTSALQASAPPFSIAFYQLIVISVIDGIAKIIAVGLALAAVIEILTGTELLSKVSVFSANRMKNHIVICGYSRIAERICNDLSDKKMKFIVIERDPQVVEMLRGRNYTVIDGDFASAEALKSADIVKARAVVFAAKDDLMNLMGIVTAKHLNPKVKIISRATEEDTGITKMQRAGAEMCVVPEILAGIEIGSELQGKVSR